MFLFYVHNIILVSMRVSLPRLFSLFNGKSLFIRSFSDLSKAVIHSNSCMLIYLLATAHKPAMKKRESLKISDSR